ncbi:MAG: transporter substrate-binding domain-containing protein [Muribaculaceae bacterium]|nr:transporter substrate-binding domain-containing protein [Muribaculaceae bacterium]
MSKASNRYIQAASYVIVLVGIIFILGIARNCSSIKTSVFSEGNSGGDTLDIAIFYGPSGMYLQDTIMRGINYDIANVYARQNALPVKIWPVSDAAYAMEMTEKGNFDILASLPLDNEVRKKFLTSESIFLDRLVLLQLKDSISGATSVNSSLDLNGKSVWVPEGSPALNRLKNLSDEIGGNINLMVEPELSDELLAVKVGAGSIPFAVVNERIAKDISENYPLLSYSNPVSFTQFQVWLFSPSDSIEFRKFNEWFETFRTSEEYREILNSY